MVLPSGFVSQSQTRGLTRFVNQGAVAVLEMPDFDAETTWLGLQVFYERLLEHGIADIALNQLRWSWIDNSRFPPQLPILWTAVEDGRLFARPVEFASGRESSAQPKLTSPGLEQEAAAPVQLNASLTNQGSRKGARPKAAKPTQQGIQPTLEANQLDQSVPAVPEDGSSRQEAATTEKPTISEDTVQTKGTAKRQPSVKAAKPPQPVNKPRTARRRPSEDQAAENSSTPAAGAAGAGQAGDSKSAGPALGGNGGGGAGGGGGAPPPIVLVDLSRYDPPEPDNVMTIRVGTSTVTLHFDAKDGLPTDYSGPNRLADPAYQQQILQATTDRKRYGNLLFDAIIHNEPGPGGQVELTTEKGFDLALSRTNRKLRIELELDQNNLAIHEYRWEFLRRGDRTPVALLEHTPSTGGWPGPISPCSSQATSNSRCWWQSATPRPNPCKSWVIKILPALDVRLETEIANLAFQHSKRLNCSPTTSCPDTLRKW